MEGGGGYAGEREPGAKGHEGRIKGIDVHLGRGPFVLGALDGAQLEFNGIVCLGWRSRVVVPVGRPARQACLAKSPNVRPSAAELLVELDAMLASTPVGPSVPRAQRLFTTTNISNMAQALTAQIRQVLLDLAAVLDRPSDDVERIQHELSELELELAMLESDVESAIDAEIAERRDGVAASVAQLQSALTDAYRDLFDAVNADRGRAVPDAHALFTELDELVEQYRSV